ncbi:hypothetical protein JTB14_003099 [Gonioctena quinquepunctata]|nr:hypothetical protein JTB14_003099 [Gonioctena quinquepunctata]
MLLIHQLILYKSFSTESASKSLIEQFVTGANFLNQLRTQSSRAFLPSSSPDDLYSYLRTVLELIAVFQMCSDFILHSSMPCSCIRTTESLFLTPHDLPSTVETGVGFCLGVSYFVDFPQLAADSYHLTQVQRIHPQRLLLLSMLSHDLQQMVPL